MTTKRIILLISIIIIGLILCFILFKGSEIPKVKTIKPTVGKIESSLLTTGTVESQKQSIICAKAKGIIGEVFVDENAKIEVGQELFNFDREEALKRLEEAQSKLQLSKIDLASAESSFVKTTALYGRQEVSEEEVENDRNLYKKALLNKTTAENELKLAKEQLDNLVYLAPQSGVIIEKNVFPRQLVFANEVLMRIVDMDNLQVCVSLSGIDVQRVKSGQEVFIKTKNLNKELTGYVKSVQPQEENQGLLSAKVIIALDTSRGTPEIGERVETRIIIESKKNVLLLNSEAIFKDGRQSFVYLYKNGSASKRVVRVGITNREQTEIIFGLSPKDKIILPERIEIKDGMKVRG